jgi:DNA (cytosine-5)-methyltransferase 1
VLNAKDYGIPQNRERVFTVSIRDDSYANTYVDPDVYYDEEAYNFKFPPKQELKLKLKDMLEAKVDEKYYLNDERTKKIMDSNFMQEKKIIQEKDVRDTLLARDWKDPKCVRIGGIFDTEKSKYQAGSIYDKEGLCPTLDVAQGGWRQPSVIIKDRIRKLTPLEYWRLMGFGDKDFKNAQSIPMSNTQLYKQAGNSIVVNVLMAILKNLLIESEDK